MKQDRRNCVLGVTMSQPTRLSATARGRSIACGSCCESDTPLRCAACRKRQQRHAVYPCLDFRGDPESGMDMGGLLPVAAPIDAWGSP